MLTEQELGAIRARCDAATPGKWIAGREADLMRPLFTFNVAVTRAAYEKNPDHFDQWARNAEFIAHSRADMPALLDEVSRLREIERQAQAQSTEAASWRAEVARLRDLIEWGKRTEADDVPAPSDDEIPF